MVLLPQAPTPATKVKSVAKARYLKKEKSKRKKRKQAAVASAPKGDKALKVHAAADSEDDGEAGTSGSESGQAAEGSAPPAPAAAAELDVVMAEPAIEVPARKRKSKVTADDSTPAAAETAEERKARKDRKKEKKRRRVEGEAAEGGELAAAAAQASRTIEVEPPVASSSRSSTSPPPSMSGSRSQSPGATSDRYRSPDGGLAEEGSLPLEPFPHQPPTVPEPTADLLHPLTVPHALSTAQIVSFSHSLPLPETASASASDPVPLSARVLQRLKDLQISSFFAVQTAVIPFLLPPPADTPDGASTVAGLYPLRKQRDVCVSAPTGSGKTLSYVVPIVEVLQKRVVTRLRALVILPTRDLVAQTRETFEAVAKSTGLKLATVTGSQGFATEQSYLVDPHTGGSLVDILVCTPGRLMDHLAGTEGFSLRDLRFLVRAPLLALLCSFATGADLALAALLTRQVIDEADRLLNQSFNDWLQIVLARTREAAHESATTASGGGGATEQLAWEGRPADNSVNQCQKLLFSATLTRDPAKIAALNLVDPQYFIIQDDRDTAKEGGAYAEESFTVPATLKVRRERSLPLHPVTHWPFYSASCRSPSPGILRRLAHLFKTALPALPSPRGCLAHRQCPCLHQVS